jgi:polyamine oxidase
LADRGFEPALYSTNGTRISSAAATALYAEFATVMDRVTTLCCRRLKAGSPDMTLREALTFSKWPAPEQQSPAQRAVEYFAVDWDFTVGAERVSLFSFASNQCDATNSKLTIAEPARFFVSDERGFAAVARALAAPFADRVLFGANVTRIDSARGRVELADGRAFTSPYVLCTFSSGVVNRAIAASSSPAAPADLVFTTPLPAWKVDAFASMPMGNYVKVFFRFPYIFWDRSLDYSLYAGTSPAGNFTVWQNLEAADGRFFPAAAGLLMATLVGAEADSAEAMTEGAVAAAGMRVLRDMFADRAVPDPIAVTVPKWRAAPAFRGAYSNAAVGANASVFDALAAPVGNLYFAGVLSSGCTNRSCSSLKLSLYIVAFAF